MSAPRRSITCQAYESHSRTIIREIMGSEAGQPIEPGRVRISILSDEREYIRSCVGGRDKVRDKTPHEEAERGGVGRGETEASRRLVHRTPDRALDTAIDSMMVFNPTEMFAIAIIELFRRRPYMFKRILTSLPESEKIVEFITELCMTKDVEWLIPFSIRMPVCRKKSTLRLVLLLQEAPVIKCLGLYRDIRARNGLWNGDFLPYDSILDRK